MKLSETYTITLENMNFFAHLGVGEEERKTGVEIKVCVKLTAVVHQGAFVNDDPFAAPDYSEAYRRIAEVMARPLKLLEKLACEIGTVLLQMQDVVAAEVKVTKPNPPVGADGMNASVNIRMAKNMD